MSPIPWVLVPLIAVLLLLIYLPPRMVRPQGTITPAERLQAESSLRTILLQFLGGTILLAGAYFTASTLGLTARTLELNREGQITERFTRAIDQLGQSDDHKLDVRLGGIYALERIARDSESDRGPIIEVLTAFLREHARWRPDSQEATPDVSLEVGSNSPELSRLRADFQAVTIVLGRNNWARMYEFDLREVDLRGASLLHANLEGSYLSDVHLDSAYLRGINLERAYLGGVNLKRAYLSGASLKGAYLRGANLEGAYLSGATLEGADLSGANLEGADLSDFNLESAKRSVDLSSFDRESALVGVNLKGANLKGVNLEGANLKGTNLEGTRGLTRVQLESAFTNEHTKLP